MNIEDLKNNINENLSTREIANLYNLDQGTIMYWLRKYKLKTNKFLKDGTKICIQCNNKFLRTEFYKSGGKKVSSYCKECVRQRNTNSRKSTKEKAVEYLGGKCSNCGYNKCFAALEFHHLDPNQKDPKYNNLRQNFTNKLKLELDKCALLCANCHREYHFKNTTDLHISANDLKNLIKI